VHLVNKSLGAQLRTFSPAAKGVASRLNQDYHMQETDWYWISEMWHKH